MATGRPDHVFVPVMPAAMMLPTAMPIEWPVLPQTCAVNSAAISLPRLSIGCGDVAARFIAEPV